MPYISRGNYSINPPTMPDVLLQVDAETSRKKIRTNAIGSTVIGQRNFVAGGGGARQGATIGCSPAGALEAMQMREHAIRTMSLSELVANASALGLRQDKSNVFVELDGRRFKLWKKEMEYGLVKLKLEDFISLCPPDGDLSISNSGLEVEHDRVYLEANCYPGASSLDRMVIPKDAPPGTGTYVLSQLISIITRAGGTELHANAVEDGLQVWPRLGFDAELDRKWGFSEKTVLEARKTEEGRAKWDALDGGSIHMVLELVDASSPSYQHWKQYESKKRTCFKAASEYLS